jgi:hypothetical protein
VPKVHNKPIKRPKKDSNIESKCQPKCALVWRTGLSGVPPDSVWCATGQCPVHQGLQLRTAHLRKFWRPLRYNSPDCPVAHRTIRCASGATSTSHQRSSAEGTKCATVHARVRAETDGTPDSKQCLSGAPPDCPVIQKTEAPTVGIQRPGDVVGAPDSVRWRTGLSGAPYDSNLNQTTSLVVGAINTPTTHHSLHPSFPTSQTLQELHHSIQDTPKRSNPLPSP